MESLPPGWQPWPVDIGHPVGVTTPRTVARLGGLGATRSYVMCTLRIMTRGWDSDLTYDFYRTPVPRETYGMRIWAEAADAMILPEILGGAGAGDPIDGVEFRFVDNVLCFPLDVMQVDTP
jgi:hypothetical protein